MPLLFFAGAKGLEHPRGIADLLIYNENGNRPQRIRGQSQRPSGLRTLALRSLFSCASQQQDNELHASEMWEQQKDSDLSKKDEEIAALRQQLAVARP
jgi:hypothetical protein